MAAEAVEVMEAQVIEVAMEVPLVVRKKDTLKETVIRFKPLPLAEMETASILMN